MSRPITETPAQRFWKKVNMDGPIPSHVPELGTCWEWTGAKIAGYGTIRIAGKNVPAHRFSFEIHSYTPIQSKWVLHHCDNPSCVNPKHLFLGDHAANTADKMKKGRHRGPRGERCARHILTSEDVQKIRINYALTNNPLAEIALAHGVKRGAIKDIVQNVNWTHLPWPSEDIFRLARERARNTRIRLGKL